MHTRQIFAVALLLLSFSSFHVVAQNESDALRFSFLSPTGTARSMGFGNALGSIGGDFASLSVNPAGIGIYRRSEFMVTPSLKFNSISGQYLGQTNSDNATKFNLNNIGIVFSQVERGKRYDQRNWKAVSFGIGFNRMADFNKNYYYGGHMEGDGNEYSSFSEVFVEDANYNNTAQAEGTLGYLGYQSYLVNYDSASGGYFTLADWRTGLKQMRAVEERGGINEIVLSLGGNYQEKLMVGATLGLPIVRYTRDAYFQEDDATGDLNNYFKSFRYSERLQTSGFGVNLKLGAIYKVSDYFRAGVAFHTPTIFGFSDIFNEHLTANTEYYSGIVTVSNPENRFNYSMVTPWRAIISASALVGKYGFISADYEYVDYSSARFRFENSYKDSERLRNDAIKSNFQAATNFRIGIEGRVDDFFIRGGFGYYGNPYKLHDAGARLDFSAGLGFRTDRFFTDIAFVRSVSEQYETPYTLAPPVVPHTAVLNHKHTNIALTVGWKL